MAALRCPFEQERAPVETEPDPAGPEPDVGCPVEREPELGVTRRAAREANHRAVASPRALAARALAMGSHARLGADSPLRVLAGHGADVVRHILSKMDVVVPDDCETLADALDLVVRTHGVRILLRAGEHTVGARRGEVAAHGVPGARVGSTKLTVETAHSHVEIVGEAGAELKGQLTFASGTRGVLRGVRHSDAGDCCVVLLGDSDWELVDCAFVCGHACAVRVEVQARARLLRCSLGGEGHVGVASVYHAYGSLQERGLAKHACYGLFAKDRAQVVAEGCALAFCSEAALFIAGAARVRLRGCALSHSRVAIFAGVGCGAELWLAGCRVAVQRGGGRLWGDDDRPSDLVITDTDTDADAGTDTGADTDTAEDARGADEGDNGAPATLCTACMQPQCSCG